jgi:hypothetical protein
MASTHIVNTTQVNVSKLDAFLRCNVENSMNAMDGLLRINIQDILDEFAHLDAQEASIRARRKVLKRRLEDKVDAIATLWNQTPTQLSGVESSHPEKVIQLLVEASTALERTDGIKK